MNFELTAAQRALYDACAAFGNTVYGSEDPVSADARAEFDRARWRACADQGLLGLLAPTASGDPAHDNLDVAVALEGFGYGCPDNGLVFAVSTQLLSVVDTLVRFAGETVREELVGPTIAGELVGCYAMTEPNAGSDCFSLEAHAVPDGDGWRLTGIKELITFAPIADYAIVFASTTPDAGAWGVSAFVVDCSLACVTRRDVQEKMGLRTVPIGRLEFDDVRIESDRMLGSPGAGASIFNATQETERALILAGQVGAMQRQLDDTVGFAKQRKQFGQSIGHFQSVSNRIVDMKIKLETCRLLLYKTAWLRDQGRSHMLEASMTNIHLAESYLDSSLNALTVRGGRGYLSENNVERDVRDAVGGALYGGTSDIQRQIIAKLLGL